MTPRRGMSTPQPFAAAFDSECANCFEDIFEGDMIVGGRGGYVHEHCPEDDRIERASKFEGTDDESMGF